MAYQKQKEDAVAYLHFNTYQGKTIFSSKFDCMWKWFIGKNKEYSNIYCDECRICRYKNFLEWAEGCAPAESTIQRDYHLEKYLSYIEN